MNCSASWLPSLGFVAAIVLLSSVSAQDDVTNDDTLQSLLARHQIETRRSGVRVCGSKLANLLQFVCEEYNSKQPSFDHRYLPGRSTEQEMDAFKQDMARSISKRNTNFRRIGIVDECCRRPCSYEVLVSYCSKPRTSFTPFKN